MIPTLPRSTVIIIDAFHLFAGHARQSLLYCLFDTVQHSKIGVGSQGMAVIGVTSRVDTINLLEKRVKSRFSGRMLRTAFSSQLDHWSSFVRVLLCASIKEEHEDEWTPLWQSSVDRFLEDPDVQNCFTDVFALTGDVQMLTRVLVRLLIYLNLIRNRRIF